MATPNSIQILLSAKDQTSGAFGSVQRGLQGIQNAGSRISGLLNTLGIGAGISAAGFAVLAKNTIDYADNLAKLSVRTSTSVKDLASLKLAAELNGTSLEAVAKGMQRITLSIGQAVTQNNKITAEALTRLNITSTDARERLFQLADAYTNASDKTKVMADLQAVLGKSYVELLPLLSQGGDELRRLAQESESYSETMARLAPDAEEFNDQLDKLRHNAAAAASALMVELVPALNQTIDRIGLAKQLIGEGGLFNTIVNTFGTDDIGVVMKRIRTEIALTEKAIAGEKRKGKDASGFEEKLKGLNAQLQILIGHQTSLAMKPPSTEYDKWLKAQRGPEIKGDLPPIIVTPKIKPPKWEEVFTRQEMDRAQRVMAAAGELSFSFISNDKAVADFIRKQYDDVNSLQAEIAETMTMYDALASGSYLTSDKSAAEFIRDQQEAVNDLNRSIAESIEKETERAEKVKETKSLAEEIGITFTSAFEDAIAAGESFSDVLQAIEKDIVKLLMRMYVTEPLMGAVKGIDFGAIFGSLFASANGNAFTNAPALSAYSGSVVSKPTVFPFASGGVPNLGLMGEAGPEAILPLKRGAGGKLGVEAAGNVVVNVTNNASGTQATATERMEGNTRIIDVMIDQVRGMIAGDIAKGGNAVSGSLERTYGLNRTAGAY